MPPANKSQVEYSLEGDEIHRKEGDSDRVVARYKDENVIFADGRDLQKYKLPVTTFLAENEHHYRHLVRADLPDDPKDTKSIPPRPKIDPRYGDKTPGVPQWYQKWRPNEFTTRYEVLGPGNVRIPRSPRVGFDPITGGLQTPWEKDEAGNDIRFDIKEGVLIARRKVDGLLWLPQDAVGFEEPSEEE